jgi:hypothetical protein
MRGADPHIHAVGRQAGLVDPWLLGSVDQVQHASLTVETGQLAHAGSTDGTYVKFAEAGSRAGSYPTALTLISFLRGRIALAWISTERN